VEVIVPDFNLLRGEELTEDPTRISNAFISGARAVAILLAIHLFCSLLLFLAAPAASQLHRSSGAFSFFFLSNRPLVIISNEFFIWHHF